jgi:hypothetical protein
MSATRPNPQKLGHIGTAAVRNNTIPGADREATLALQEVLRTAA